MASPRLRVGWGGGGVVAAMRWADFPDVTDEFEPDLPDDTDACQSELKVAGESRAVPVTTG